MREDEAGARGHDDGVSALQEDEVESCDVQGVREGQADRATADHDDSGCGGWHCWIECAGQGREDDFVLSLMCDEISNCFRVRQWVSASSEKGFLLRLPTMGFLFRLENFHLVASPENSELLQTVEPCRPWAFHEQQQLSGPRYGAP